ncbi:MAG: 2-amino-4-hydroxy-6-hydroxymethyldihydropteridine diphosphokinase [Erythrobacter sp.]
MTQLYLIALGSNMRVPAIGGPRRVLEAAVTALGERTITVLAASPILDSAPLGPSLRHYANAAAVIETALEPPDLLKTLHQIEHFFGRGRNQRRGQRWRARALDLDIVLWSGGIWADNALTIPHREFRRRDFVLQPACDIAANWRDPITGLAIAHLLVRLHKTKKWAPDPVVGRPFFLPQGNS